MNRNNIRQPDNAPCPAPSLSSLQIIAKQPVSQIGQQAVAQLAQSPVSQILSIPWGHNLAILAKCKQHDEALYYAQATQTFGWSRSVLVHQIESGLWQREGKAITNFAQTLPAAQSDLARQMLKDPYKFDFFSLSKEHTERELETSLVAHITQFLLELGAGFNPEFTGRENVFLNGAILGLSREQMAERFEAIVDFAEIGEEDGELPF